MLIILDNFPDLIINQEEIDGVLKWSGCTHKEYCERVGFDYDIFERIYNNDRSVTIEQLISFAECLHRPLRDFVCII